MTKGKVLRLGLISGLLLGLLIACGGPSGPEIEVKDVWARPAMAAKEGAESSEGGGMGKPMPGTGAVFMTLKNSGGAGDRLIGGQTDAADVVEIHETVMEGEVMKMRMLGDGLKIGARDEVLLKPGGYHVMLIGIKRDLKVGDTFSLDLLFEQSGTITIEPEVRMP